MIKKSFLTTSLSYISQPLSLRRSLPIRPLTQAPHILEDTLRKLRSIMHYQQLRILAFIVGALVHQSETADFWCDDGYPPVSCESQIGSSGEYFSFGTDQGCTSNGKYCAQITATNSDSWTISVLNYGHCDSDNCLGDFCDLDCPWQSDDLGANSCSASGC